MDNPSFDPGLTKQVTGPLRRIIKKNGQFNVRRRGTTWRDFHPYLYLVNTTWPKFFCCLFAGYMLVNTMFAVAYYVLGPDQLAGVDTSTPLRRLISDFFFSSHTLSTVGYGSISPHGMAANAVRGARSAGGGPWIRGRHGIALRAASRVPRRGSGSARICW